MKTTLDLPESLVRELQRRARQLGQELPQLAAELLWEGLAASPPTTVPAPPAMIHTHPVTGLPYVECPQAASPDDEMTPDRVANLLIEQEATWRHEAGR